VQAGTRYHKDIGKFLLLGLVAVHVLAVLFHVLKKRDPLISAMWHGYKSVKQDHPESNDGPKHRLLALILLLLCAGAVAWLVWYGFQRSAAAWG
jgi:ABC-type transporter Mla subunit MlaD